MAAQRADKQCCPVQSIDILYTLCNMNIHNCSGGKPLLDGEIINEILVDTAGIISPAPVND